ncbi:ribosomal RNA large subunit methyltransferase H [Bacteroidia bacterium]|nr:ribosomal RNA large subunit methyltransferase H [Bacteroidia bacterium]
MTVELIVMGKTDIEPVDELIRLYQRRINHYVKMNVITLPQPRATGKTTEAVQCRLEGEALLGALGEGDCVVLLDERGGQHDSPQFAAWLQKRFNAGPRRLVFVIGGPYGFSPQVRARADEMLSLSSMTFSHQIVRAIFCEQLYRALTILSGEPYHHK